MKKIGNTQIPYPACKKCEKKVDCCELAIEYARDIMHLDIRCHGEQQIMSMNSVEFSIFCNTRGILPPEAFVKYQGLKHDPS